MCGGRTLNRNDISETTFAQWRIGKEFIQFNGPTQFLQCLTDMVPDLIQGHRAHRTDLQNRLKVRSERFRIRKRCHGLRNAIPSSRSESTASEFHEVANGYLQIGGREPFEVKSVLVSGRTKSKDGIMKHRKFNACHCDDDQESNH